MVSPEVVGAEGTGHRLKNAFGVGLEEDVLMTVLGAMLRDMCCRGGDKGAVEGGKAERGRGLAREWRVSGYGALGWRGW